MTDTAREKQEELLIKTIAELVITWQVFHRSHDLETAKITCCNKSQDLWMALERLERLVVGAKGD